MEGSFARVELYDKWNSGGRASTPQLKSNEVCVCVWVCVSVCMGVCVGGGGFVYAHK